MLLDPLRVIQVSRVTKVSWAHLEIREALEMKGQKEITDPVDPRSV